MVMVPGGPICGVFFRFVLSDGPHERAGTLEAACANIQAGDERLLWAILWFLIKSQSL